jgi:trehalose-6-phosphatase
VGRAAAPFDSAMGSHCDVTSTALLSEGTQALTSFALSNVLLAFDYDGALAPIASTPARARMRHTTRALLGRVAVLYPCVVISGRAAREAVLKTAASLRNVRLVGGSEAINLLRRDAPDKGSALSYAVSAFACHTAVYVGDDDTDEDAFRALPSERLLSVRIGNPLPGSAARFDLVSQREIDELLERLITMRSQGRASRTRDSQPATG